MSNKPGHRGEHEVSRKTIARGMPGLLRRTCGDYARVLFTFAREAAGALGTGIPCALRYLGANGFCKTSGASRREIADAYVGLDGNTVIPGRCEASNPESRDSGSGANAPSRNDGPTTELSLAV